MMPTAAPTPRSRFRYRRHVAALLPQADLLDIGVERPADVETTAAGAAICAGVGAGMWGGLEDVAAPAQEGASNFAPAISREERADRCSSWDQAVAASFGWAERR